MSTASIFLEGISLLGPGLNGWEASRAILRGEQLFEPTALQVAAPAALPATERRRAGLAVKLSMATGLAAVEHAQADAATLPSIFSSTGGDCENCHSILEVLASPERMISPTRFHNSVHNAPAGYWSIAARARATSNVMCAHDGSFAAGLLESVCQVAVDGVPTLLIAYDTDYPEPLRAVRPIDDAFGVALVLAPQASAAALARLDVTLTDANATSLATPELEALRTNNPAARALPLLEALAARRAGRVVIDYLPETRVQIDVAMPESFGEPS